VTTPLHPHTLGASAASNALASLRAERAQRHIAVDRTMHKQYCTSAQNDKTCLMSQRSNHYNISSSISQIHTHSELIYPTAVTICQTITTNTIKQYHFVTILSQNIVNPSSTLPRRLRRRLLDASSTSPPYRRTHP
jgi:hypothetical protein